MTQIWGEVSKPDAVTVQSASDSNRNRRRFILAKPVTITVQRAVNSNNKRMKEQTMIKRKLSVKLTLLLIANSIILAVITFVTVYSRLENRLIDEYTVLAERAADIMTIGIDPDKAEEYIKLNYSMEEYRHIAENLKILKDSFDEILYMYVYIIGPEGGRTVFDICDDPDEPGYVYEFDDIFVPYIEDLCAGKEIPVLTGYTDYGYLLTYTRPVFDSRGNYAYTIFLDFSMDKLHEENVSFIISLILILGAAMLLILVLHILIINRILIKPLSDMTECISSFKYSDEEDRFRNLRSLEELKVDTGDELETLYRAFVSAEKDTFYYIMNFNIAKADIQDKDETIANISDKARRDSLTGVGNKTAWVEASSEENRRIKAGNDEFAVLMLDINNLKYVNDTFGHGHGDEYIRGCCRILCETFKSSPVFRIGGDEFVTIVKNEDYVKREERVESLREKYEKSFSGEDKKPWERYSASIGIAVYSEEKDSSIEDVFKRADNEMYESKNVFHEKHGQYR